MRNVAERFLFTRVMKSSPESTRTPANSMAVSMCSTRSISSA